MEMLITAAISHLRCVIPLLPKWFKSSVLSPWRNYTARFAQKLPQVPKITYITDDTNRSHSSIILIVSLQPDYYMDMYCRDSRQTTQIAWTLAQCCFNVGPASQTMEQHWSNKSCLLGICLLHYYGSNYGSNNWRCRWKQLFQNGAAAIAASRSIFSINCSKPV